MAAQYVYINGNRVAPGVAGAFHRMNYDYKRAFPGEQMLVTSGVRTYAEQLWMHQEHLAGRWNLALHPDDPLAYHVETNPRGQRALDVRDSGADPGILTPSEPEARWLRANCSKYGFKDAGYYFRQIEPWHIEYQLDPWKIEGWMTLPNQPASVPDKPKQNATIFGDEDMFTVNYNGHLFNMDKQFVKHFTGDEDHEFFKNAARAKDDWISTNSEKRFHTLLNGLGIPQNVVQISGRNAQVLDPQANNGRGNFRPGGVWSRERQILAKLGVFN